MFHSSDAGSRRGAAKHMALAAAIATFALAAAGPVLQKKQEPVATSGARDKTPSRTEVRATRAHNLLSSHVGQTLSSAGEREVTELGHGLSGSPEWIGGPPVLAPADRDGDHYYSVKDPSIVRYAGRWHVFCTVRGRTRSHQIEYISFADWAETAKAERRMLRLTDGYFCAPQVFYFRPHRKWYLICQVSDPSRKPALQPAWSSAGSVSEPASWTAPKLLFSEHPKSVKMWIDFWVICDDRKAHLFFTSLDGKMWRSETRLEEFPAGWSEPQVVLEGDIYEASHTYRLKDSTNYLTIVEAQAPGGRRYYKAYVAGRLDGQWSPLAATAEQLFAAPGNVRFEGERWSDSFSHGELIRDGYDETLTVDPAGLQFLFQGVRDSDRQGKVYGEIPWRLGLLKLVVR